MTLLDDHEIVVAVHRDDVRIGVAAQPMITKLTIVEAIEKIFDHAHRGTPGHEVDASAKLRPIRAPGILDRVVATFSQEREQDREGGSGVLGTMAAAVDDDLQMTMFLGDAAQQICVDLAALIGADALLVNKGFVVKVQADDLSLGEKVLPHAQC